MIDIQVISVVSEEQLELSWLPVNLGSDSLELQLIFEDPLEVSSGIQDYGIKDSMFVTILNDTYFVGQDKSQMPVYINLDKATAIAQVNKQMKNNEMSKFMMKNAEGVTDSMNIFLMFQLGMNVMLSSAISMIIGLFNVMQIVCF